MQNVHMHTRPPAPRRAQQKFGECLQAMRRSAGLTLEGGTTVTRLATSTLSRYEAGARLPHPNQLDAIIRGYKPAPDLERMARDYYAAANGDAWWQPYSVDETMDALLSFEADATTIRTYHPSAVPGLLQTPDYARAFLSEGVLPGDQGEVERRLELRLRRQQILDADHPPTLHVVLDETAFYANIGGPDVMAGQVEHLHNLSQRANIQCQILPQAAGAHAGRDGSFVIFDLPPPEPGDAPEKAVYTQALFGAFIPESPATIARYCDAFEQLVRLASTPVSSRQTLSTMTRSS